LTAFISSEIGGFVTANFILGWCSILAQLQAPIVAERPKKNAFTAPIIRLSQAFEVVPEI